jgi:hypothetical protein
VTGYPPGNVAATFPIAFKKCEAMNASLRAFRSHEFDPVGMIFSGTRHALALVKRQIRRQPWDSQR